MIGHPSDWVILLVGRQCRISGNEGRGCCPRLDADVAAGFRRVQWDVGHWGKVCGLASIVNVAIPPPLYILHVVFVLKGGVSQYHFSARVFNFSARVFYFSKGLGGYGIPPPSRCVSPPEQALMPTMADHVL